MTPSARSGGQGSCRGAEVIGLGPMGDLPTLSFTEPVRVGTLRLVVLHLDTAITATRALASLDSRLNRDGQWVLRLERELRLGKGWRQRLDAAEERGYGPRLMITNSEPIAAVTATAATTTGDTFTDGRAKATTPANGLRPGVKRTNPLSFSFLGQRARAETQWQQRQSGLLEALVAASIQPNAHHPSGSLPHAVSAARAIHAQGTGPPAGTTGAGRG